MTEYILTNVPLFNNLQNDEIKALTSCVNAKVKKYRRNEILINEGDIIEAIGIVLEGTVQISRFDIDGNRMIVSSVQKDGMFAETYALSQKYESPVIVTATEDTAVMWLNVNRLLITCSSACSFHSKLIRNIIELLTEKNIYLNRKLDLLSKKTLREKILHFLYTYSGFQKNKHFTIPYNRLMMADYLGVDRSALSRELSNMKDEGLIDYSKNTFILL